MKILLAYNYYKHQYIDIGVKMEALLHRLRNANIDIHGFPLTVNPPGDTYYWKELDARWKRGDKKLCSLYENLGIKSESFDILVNYNGTNLHPDFVQQLSTFNIFSCFDDPESSEILSKPVAAAYDMSLVGNIAEVETYLQWGAKEVRFFPLGFYKEDYDPELTKEKILSESRSNDIVLLCERKTNYRANRLNKFAKAFPNGEYYGLGWPKGFLAENSIVDLYQKSKIGPNFHNSTGPINFRTYILPANGVLQICDNKSFLGKIFELDKEVIGFDTVEEAIEKTNYYLAHENERKLIAAAGWERAIKDYNEVSVFSLIEKYSKLVMSNKKEHRDQRIYLWNHRKRTRIKRIIYVILFPLRIILKIRAYLTWIYSNK
ncbi:MAG: glycosyltransferase [Bacteroidales bacterium]|nr:glycosyltransferase [Bacteroidales bacterium]